MDRTVFTSVEREIDEEIRARFPGDVIKQAVLLHHGDDPEIEPGELWVQVLLRADRPEDYDEIITAFRRDHEAALEEFPRYLAEMLREICLVEFTFGNDPVTGEALGPSDRTEFSLPVGDLQAWKLGKQRKWQPGWDRAAWKHSTP